MKKLIVISALLTGCAVQPYENPYLDGQYSADRAGQTAGYTDGCNSGSAATGNILKRYKQDIQAYTSDMTYKAGWDAGFHECKAMGDAINDAMPRRW